MGLGRRRHSTGDMAHNDYEELDSVKRTIALATSGVDDTNLDQPPELPARPPSFFGQGKHYPQGRSGLAAALGVLQGLRSLSFRDIKHREGSSQETLTSSKHKEGLLSRSGSFDLYDTIGDVDSRTFRRSSSDITPVTSHPDLRFPDRPANLRSRTVVPVLGGSAGLVGCSPDGFAGTDGAESRSRPQSLSLLSFSESDVPQPDGTLSSQRIGTSSSKSALLDFFLDDASFHSNPMVTGDLRASEGLKEENWDTSTPPAPLCSQGQPAFPEPTQPVTEGWADFSDFSKKVSSPGFQSSNPFMDSSSWAHFTSGESTAWECSGERESVYIDMRKQQTQENDGACEYVASEDLNRDQAFLNFLLFQ